MKLHVTDGFHAGNRGGAWGVNADRLGNPALGLPFLHSRQQCNEVTVMANHPAYEGFVPGVWQERIDVRDFIQRNYTPYTGDEGFLCGPTARTTRLMDKLHALQREEQARGGVLSINTDVATSLLNYAPGYLDRDEELIVGLQTETPLRRGVNPFGGMRMAEGACRAYGYEMSPKLKDEFLYRTTHNDGVYRVYTDDMRRARKIGVITGLPDAYGRGRIIGDYRRVALYGIDRLIEEKQRDKRALGRRTMDYETVRQSEELFQQIAFLQKTKEMAALYGIDIAGPAATAQEAIQWTYFGYLASIKEQNGAAMSLGRVSTFLDIYIERDLARGTLTEERAQELMDDFVMKLRMARHLRTPEYNELFGGDPMWITESVGGMGEDGRTLVTKNAFRMLHTLHNLGPAPEPNLTVLYARALPEAFKRYCARVSCQTSAIQYENDDLMRPLYGDDYGIACCVSAMRLGKEMQFFGARCNLPKLLLLALNGGHDTLSGLDIGPRMDVMDGDVLDFERVYERFAAYRTWLCELYVNTMNVIHYMHDKYAYEKTQMALHDTDVHRYMAFGVAGLSVLADSLSAIRYARVRPMRDADGYIVDFTREGDFPTFGNDDDRVDGIAVRLVQEMIRELRKTPAYRGAEHTLSVLTITSNVVYGKKTAATPDGRKQGEPFAPGANPMHGRELCGAAASLNSVAKLPYADCRDGISNTFSIVPDALGPTPEARERNLCTLLDAYFGRGAHHINVNVMNRALLQDAYEHPENYPNLTIRVSGYAVNFVKLSREQQREVIRRTFHEAM